MLARVPSAEHWLLKKLVISSRLHYACGREGLLQKQGSRNLNDQEKIVASSRVCPTGGAMASISYTFYMNLVLKFGHCRD